MLTKTPKSKKPKTRGTWKLQDAKTHLSKVVRLAQSEGPQRVTVHGKDAAVVVSASDYDKRRNAVEKGQTGAVFVEAMQQAGKLGLKLRPLRYYPVYRPPVTFEDKK